MSSHTKIYGPLIPRESGNPAGSPLSAFASCASVDSNPTEARRASVVGRGNERKVQRNDDGAAFRTPADADLDRRTATALGGGPRHNGARVDRRPIDAEQQRSHGRLRQIFYRSAGDQRLPAHRRRRAASRRRSLPDERRRRMDPDTRSHSSSKIPVPAACTPNSAAPALLAKRRPN
jgi:hypothetical protein